jgi:hypothetical protein
VKSNQNRSGVLRSEPIRGHDDSAEHVLEDTFHDDSEILKVRRIADSRSAH